MHLASVKPAPPSLPDRHLAILAVHGIEPARLLLFADHAELCRIAAEKGVDPQEIENYGTGTRGLRIQEDENDLGGPNVWILIQSPLPPEARGETIDRLRGWEFDCPACITAAESMEGVLAFILLHEIAHHVLCHGKPGSLTEGLLIEREADQWALEAMHQHDFR